VVYQKVLDNKLMKTPVGWECLSRMRQQMITAGIAPERIPAIVLHNNFTARSAGGSGLRADGEVADIMASGIARQRIRPTEHREKTEAEKYRSRFRMAVGVSIILFGIVVAMFVIALNSSNPNIINYENRILDKYSSWEEELTIREQAVKEKERALNG
jgi:hypothetical protein